MSTLTARSSSIQKTSKSGLVPVLDDAAWLAKFLTRKAPPVPVVTISAKPPRILRQKRQVARATRDIWNLASPGTIPSKEQAELALSSVASVYGTTPGELRGHSKVGHIVVARREAIAAIRQACPSWSASHIARFMNLDHTSVLYALKRIAAVSQVVGMWRAHDGDTAHIARVTGLTEAKVCALIAADQDRRAAAKAEAKERLRAYEKARRLLPERKAANNRARMALKRRRRLERLAAQAEARS